MSSEFEARELLQSPLVRHRSPTGETPMRLMSSFAVLLLLVLAACAVRGPVAGGGDKPANVGGTISGIVRTSSDTPLSGRQVTAVNVATGQRIETSTGMNGGFTMKVAPGHYRLEVELRAGEVVATQPDEVHITTSDLDAGRNFVITTKGLAR